MKNSSTVQFEFTGGYEAGDYELIKDGFKIGNVYQGEHFPDENKVWVGLSLFYVGLNCKLLNQESK